MRIFFGASVLGVVTTVLLASLLGPGVAEAQLPPSHDSNLYPGGPFTALHDAGEDPLAPKYLDPLGQGCTTCHGPGLDDGVAPSCYSCHGDYWTYSDAGMTDFPENQINLMGPEDRYLPYLDNPIPLYPDSHTHVIGGIGLQSAGDSGWSCWYCHKEIWFSPAKFDNLSYSHAPGHGTPYESGCDDCHGSNLHGENGFAISCRWCHQDQWVKPESVPWPDRVPPDHRNLSTYGNPSDNGAELKGGYAWHRRGWDNPYSVWEGGGVSPDGCTRCHGPNLDDGFAPSCFSCHGPGGGPPLDHDQDKNGTMHRPGYEAPLENGCTQCHGPNLNDEGYNTSCFTCHAATWADHDFAGRSWLGEKNPCYVCHISSPSSPGGWKHALSPTTGYSVSTTTLADVGDPTGVSALCMSCHEGYEGNVAVDDFEGTLSDPPAEFIVGSAAFGTNLRQHHPVSFSFDTALASAHGGLNDPSTAPSYLASEGTIAQDMLDDGQLQCTACHDPHDNTNGDYLVNTGSTLCFTCHQFVAQAGMHHIPGRDDPWGIFSGTDFNCTMCHGDLLQGNNGIPGCVECHSKWDPTDGDQSSPDDPDVPASHHGLDAKRHTPLVGCAVCHADPVTGRLTGTTFGVSATPSCGQCHADLWSAPPFSVDAGGPYEGGPGETMTLTATFHLPAEPSEGDTLDATWNLGDGTPPALPTLITYTGGAWDGDLTIDHVFPVGQTTGSILLTNGIDEPVSDTFTVNIVDPDAPTEDRWYVNLGVGGTFFITLTAYGDDGVFTAVKGDGSVAFGIEADGVIFWVDMVFAPDSWETGNVYFGNIDRDTGVMNGIFLTTSGATEWFTGVKN